MLRSVALVMDNSKDSDAATELAIRWAKEDEASLTVIVLVSESAIHKGELVPIGGEAFTDEPDREALHEARTLAQRTVDDLDARGHRRRQGIMLDEHSSRTTEGRKRPVRITICVTMTFPPKRGSSQVMRMRPTRF